MSPSRIKKFHDLLNNEENDVYVQARSIMSMAQNNSLSSTKMQLIPRNQTKSVVNTANPIRVIHIPQTSLQQYQSKSPINLNTVNADKGSRQQRSDLGHFEESPLPIMTGQKKLIQTQYSGVNKKQQRSLYSSKMRPYGADTDKEADENSDRMKSKFIQVGVKEVTFLIDPKSNPQ